MKIMHLRSAEFFGGPERAIIGQCRAMKQHSFLCSAFVRDKAENIFLRQCESEGIDSVAIDESFPGDFRVISRLKRVIREKHVDLIVCHDYKANFYGYLAARKSGARVISHFRGRTTTNLKDRFYNFIDWRMLRRFPTVITVSNASKNILIAHGVLAAAVRVVPNAIDCKPDSAGPQTSTVAAADGSVKVVAAGRLSYEKGYDILVDAVSSIRDRAPAFKLSIYGNGPEETKLKQAVKEKGVADTVEFCGFVQDIKPVFREALLMVLPSRSEGMPNVILEAWSQQLGVLATAVGGVPDMVDDNVSGLLVPSEDSEALGNRLLWALNHAQQVKEMGKRGYQRACSDFNFDRQAELLDEIYSECMQGKIVS